MRRLVTLCFIITTMGVMACKPTVSKGVCKSFHVGKFAFRPANGRVDFSYLIDRNDSLQTETEQQTGHVTILKVKWVNSYTYQLSLLSTTQTFPESIQRLRKAMPLTTEILEGNDQYYVFRSQRAITDPVLIDTIWVRR